jgi:hypothetical protein
MLCTSIVEAPLRVITNEHKMMWYLLGCTHIHTTIFYAQLQCFCYCI